MIDDVVAALRELVAPEPEERDETAAQPLEWAPGLTYAYATRNAEAAFETGPSARQDFTVRIVRLERAELGSEEAALQRDAQLSAALDAWRASTFAAVRANRTTELWAHVAALEAPGPRTADARGVAIDVSGYRLVGG